VILTAHQPAYLPWLGYFAKMAAADGFVLHDESRYERRGMLNRNKILTAQGPLMLTVPLAHEDLRAERLLREIRVVDDGWRRRHWKAIQLAYRRAPYFELHADFLESYYGREYSTHAELCEPFVDYATAALGLPPKLGKTSELELPPFDRHSIIPILCERFGAETFVAGAKVGDYLSWDVVRARGIDVQAFHYDHPTYRQLFGSFVPRLSVLDLLVNCGPESGDVVRRSV
jgi:WbqC-like protein family